MQAYVKERKSVEVSSKIAVRRAQIYCARINGTLTFPSSFHNENNEPGNVIKRISKKPRRSTLSKSHRHLGYHKNTIQENVHMK